MRRLFATLALVLVLPALAQAQYVSHGLTIPEGAIINWPSAEISAAATRYNASPSTYPLVSPNGNEQRIFRQCDLYTLTGTFTAANGHTNFTSIDTTGDVIAWLDGSNASIGDRNGWLYPGAVTDEDTADYSQNMDDNARYYGFVTLACISATWSQMNDTQREYIVRRLVRAIAGPLNKTWGGSTTSPGNNYFWAYTANAAIGAALLASHARGIPWTPLTTNCDRATGFENGSGTSTISVCNKTIDQIIETFLDESLDVRWPVLVSYLSNDAKGGWAPESQNYGHYLLKYIGQMMEVLDQFGLDLSDDTPYWKEYAWAIIHLTSNRPLYPVQGVSSLGSFTAPWYQFPPSGNSQDVYGAPPAGTLEEGEYMTWAVRKRER